MKRHGELIGIKRECVAAYIDYHCAVWPEVAAKITECNIRNYSIYMHDGLLFAYYEYVGDDFEADMAKMAEHPKTQEWWATVKPLQSPLNSRKNGEWWAAMEEVFHQD